MTTIAEQNNDLSRLAHSNGTLRTDRTAYDNAKVDGTNTCTVHYVYKSNDRTICRQKYPITHIRGNETLDRTEMSAFYKAGKGFMSATDSLRPSSHEER